MDTHEIIVFGSECDEHQFHTRVNVSHANNIADLENLLARNSVQACIVDCNDEYEAVFDAIARLRPDITVAFCEKFDFQRLVIATETARLLRIRLVAGLWRQSSLGIIADIDQLLIAEANVDTDNQQMFPVPLRVCKKHQLNRPVAAVKH